MNWLTKGILTLSVSLLACSEPPRTYTSTANPEIAYELEQRHKSKTKAMTYRSIGAIDERLSTIDAWQEQYLVDHTTAMTETALQCLDGIMQDMEIERFPLPCQEGPFLYILTSGLDKEKLKKKWGKDPWTIMEGSIPPRIYVFLTPAEYDQYSAMDAERTELLKQRIALQ